MTLGQAMRKAREEKGYSRQKLANKSNEAYDSIIAWEKDKCVPNVLSVIALANALEITLDEMVGREYESNKC